MKAQIPWLRVFVEGVVIVGSILLAFGIQAWWDERQERADESLLLSGLQADFEALRPSLLDRLERTQRQERGGQLLRDRVASFAAEPTLEVADSLILAVVGSPTFRAATGTLDAALASGEIELIRNEEIRSEIRQWRTLLFYASQNQQGTRQVTDEQVIPLLARDLEIGPYLDLVGPGPFASWTEIDGHAVLRPSLELSGAVALRNHYQAFLKENLTILLTHLDRLLALVEAERQVPDPVGGN